MNPMIDKKAEKIIYTLNNQGYEAYIVGGCVRDIILGRIPEDWDITTSAKPEETKACFSHTYDTGIKHGTITVLLGQDKYEITTYRIESEYSDCRHPDEVQFTRNLHEDLLRRDFTMNAIAYHPKEGFVDPFGGIDDINKKIIKGVGCPEERFREDALRMLRAVRFAAQLGFEIEQDTWSALKRNAELISNISAERIRDELQKLIMSKRPEKISFLAYSGLMDKISIPLGKVLKDEWIDVSEELKRSQVNVPLRWAVFLKRIGTDTAEKLMRSLKFDTKTLKLSMMIIEEDKNEPCINKYEAKKTASRMGLEAYELLIKLYKAEKRNNADESAMIYDEIISNKECILMKDLAINGNKLKKLGVTDGKQIGEALNEILDYVHKNPQNNTEEHLARYTVEHFLDM